MNVPVLDHPGQQVSRDDASLGMSCDEDGIGALYIVDPFRLAQVDLEESAHRYVREA